MEPTWDSFQLSFVDFQDWSAKLQTLHHFILLLIRPKEWWEEGGCYCELWGFSRVRRLTVQSGAGGNRSVPQIFKFWNQKFCSWSLVKLCWAGAQSDQFVLDKIKIFNWCDTISICQPSSERALLLLNKGKFLTSKWQKSRRFANEFVYFKWSTGKISLKMRRICTKIIIWTCTARNSNT